MKRGHEEKKHKTSPWPTRLGRGGNIDIPLDLKVEKLKKLPAKSLARLRSVSKEWSSIISSRREFIESIVTRSLTQPPRDAHIIFHYASSKCFLALPSSTTCHTDKEILLVPEKDHQSVRGLICCWSGYRTYVVAICSPTTRQSFYLPELKDHTIGGTCLFGYDPLENQYKVVFLPEFTREESCQVFTLGDATAKQWRTIQGSIGPYSPLRGVVCINRTIYYQEAIKYRIWKLMSFDVRSERFHHVEAPTTLTDHQSILINYQGKLGSFVARRASKFGLWRHKDGPRFSFARWRAFKLAWRVSGVTRGGEIVFAKYGYFFHDIFCVYYYDPK